MSTHDLRQGTSLYDSLCALPDTIKNSKIYAFSDGWDNSSVFTIYEAIEKLNKLGENN